MGEALGTVLPIAVAVAVFPIPIVASVLLVAGDRGRLRGVLFVGGWLAGLAVVGGVVLLIGSRLDSREADSDPATWTSLVVLLVGLGLVALAAKQWRGRPGGDEEAPVPGWVTSIDESGLGRVSGLGFALSGLNPKNILLTVAAAAEIAYFELTTDQALVVFGAFVLLASGGVFAPIMISLALRARAATVLERLRGWMIENNATIMTILFVVIGAKLIGDAIIDMSR